MISIEAQRILAGFVAAVRGITVRCAECSRCRAALYPEDIRCDALPCDEECPAKAQLEEMYP